jgi:6-phosphofructokinase 2
MTQILTITLNPALDLATETDVVRPGVKLRCGPPRIDPGGGGINVARAVQRLGGQAFALVASGGATGAQMLALLAMEGVRTGLLAAPGDTRISLSVADRATGEQYRFMLPGPAWSDADIRTALIMLEGALFEGEYCVLSGSQPPGLADDFTAKFAEICAGKAAKLVVDTGGRPLAALVADPGPGVEVLRMNQEEAEELAGRIFATATETAEFAATLVESRVARIVVVARGGEGSVLVSDGLRVFCVSPRVEVKSKVGAGDSFVGGLTLALARGEPPERALCQGVAAAAAAVMTEGTALCSKEDVEMLLPKCELQPIEH